MRSKHSYCCTPKLDSREIVGASLLTRLKQRICQQIGRLSRFQHAVLNIRFDDGRSYACVTEPVKLTHEQVDEQSVSAWIGGRFKGHRYIDRITRLHIVRKIGYQRACLPPLRIHVPPSVSH